MSSSLDEFDLNAAILRHSLTDIRAFMGALATRLETALPGAVEVARKRDGFFSSSSHVTQIKVRDPQAVYTLELAAGRLSATRANAVRGVTLGTATLPVPQWLAELKAAIARQAESGAEAGDVLHGFL